jgi:AcrR family transcriptional regulator
LQAVVAITENGYQSISLRKLLSSLNLTTGSFYKHFESKTDLFENVAIEISKSFSVQASSQLRSNADALNRLIDLGEFIIHQMTYAPNLMEFLLFNPSVIPIYAKKSDNHSFGLLTLTHQIVGELIEQYNLAQSENDLFIKVWSFIQGYGILISKSAITYDRIFLLSVAKQLIREK